MGSEMCIRDRNKSKATLPCFCFAWQAQAQSSVESTQVPPIPIPVSVECKHLEGDEQEKCTQNTVMQFIRENLTYPQQAKELGVCGTVFVWCFVGIDGSVTDAKVVREEVPRRVLANRIWAGRTCRTGYARSTYLRFSRLRVWASNQPGTVCLQVTLWIRQRDGTSPVQTFGYSG